MQPILQMSDINKNYGTNPVLRSVNLEVMPGEIHGLVGENGAGKSTLLKILLGSPEVMLSGAYSGKIYLEGKAIQIRSPREASRLGIGMVHQEFALIPEFSVAQNIKLGREWLHPFSQRILGNNLARVDHRHNLQQAQEVLRGLGLELDPDLKVAQLPASVKQLIELARELSRDDLKLLILDEPTSSLGEEDAARMLKALRAMAHHGISILFVSHRLEEVAAVCDRVTVLRDGQVTAVFNRAAAGFDLSEIVQAMLGRELLSQRLREPYFGMNKLLSLRNFSVDMPGEQLTGLNLDIREGEILGLTGLTGHGRSAIGNGLMGLFPVQGQAVLRDKNLDLGNTSSLIRQGIYLLPDERRLAGLLLDQSVMLNIVFAALQQDNRFLKPFPLAALRWLDRRQAETWAQQAVQDFDIRCQSIHQAVRALSGGNQQKVCLARALSLEPRLLFIHEPTRGIDIGAREVILKALVRMNQENGITLVCASGELSELIRICDRIAVFHQGRLSRIIEKPDDFPLAV